LILNAIRAFYNFSPELASRLTHNQSLLFVVRRDNLRLIQAMPRDIFRDRARNHAIKRFTARRARARTTTRWVKRS